MSRTKSAIALLFIGSLNLACRTTSNGDSTVQADETAAVGAAAAADTPVAAAAVSRRYPIGFRVWNTTLPSFNPQPGSAIAKANAAFLLKF